MNYEDTWSWPDIPVEEIDREEIETVFSFGHYDGPGSGLIKWDTEYYYFSRFEIRDDRYWIIELTEAEQKYAYWFGMEWARLFHNGCSYTPDGKKILPSKEGIFGFQNQYGSIELNQEEYSNFSKNHKHPEPNKNAKVVDYFTGWYL